MTFRDWITDSNNPKLPKSEYLYGTRHVIVLIIVAVLAVLLSIIFYNKRKNVKTALMQVLGGVLLFFEIASRVVNLIIATEYTFESVFKIIAPMHICSVIVWVFIIAIFTQNKVLINFSSICGLLATLAFLLYPAVGLHKVYMSFTCIYSTVSHMIGFICSILMMALGFASFKLNKIWQTLLCFIIMFVWGAVLNFIILPGSDYMYMINDPLELGLNFPYQILYAMVILVYISLFYLIPIVVKKFKKERLNSN